MMGSLVKEDLSVNFDAIEDPRLDRNKLYPLCEIIFLALVGALLGIESWRGLELLGNERLDFLRRFFEYTHGIPSHQTIARVFSILKPQSFESFFKSWASSLSGSNAGRQIALDGKTLRGSGGSGKEMLHLLHACAVDNGLALAQLEVGAKTNEITVVPQMIDALDVRGAMISVDALNTQKEITVKIVDAGADYTLALKGNHKLLNEEVALIFDTTKPSNHLQEVEKAHGRITSRDYAVLTVSDDILPQKIEWKGLEAIGRVQTLTQTGDKETSETRYFLLSYADVQLFAKSARGHWGVEAMHWNLDVIYGEDASLKRKDHAPRNYSLIRKFALNIIRTLKGKLSVRLVHIKANANTSYLQSLLDQSGFKPLIAD
ncbi:MAG: ISAs1 family transposase [Chlamydiae bacterium]|nr:ISAs1 family transposase [Chlamydiota bacterium]